MGREVCNGCCAGLEQGCMAQRGDEYQWQAAGCALQVPGASTVSTDKITPLGKLHRVGNYITASPIENLGCRVCSWLWAADVCSICPNCSCGAQWVPLQHLLPHSQPHCMPMESHPDKLALFGRSFPCSIGGPLPARTTHACGASGPALGAVLTEC